MLVNISDKCPCCNSKKIISYPAILMPFISHRVFNWMPSKIDTTWKLKTIKKGNAYSLSNTQSCKQCGMLFLDIRFNDEQMSKLYNGYRDKKYAQLRENMSRVI
jgi:predicted Zn-ribbon and HTH transcriptional regulator